MAENPGDEIKILVLGMPRTGTQSLADALGQLGLGPIYHMREVARNKHQTKWIAALEAKFEGKGSPFGRSEFASFLGGFVLIGAFPNAKIILTVRDEDKWFDSMMATLWHWWSAPDRPRNTSMRSMADKYHLHLWRNDFPTSGKESYRKHNSHVREIASVDNLLVYDVREGWGPLCAFLGLEAPTTPFPRSDDWLEYKQAHGTGKVNQSV
ncbi:hypothetical protein BO71DRAFT_449343 [Aspergillus ellipticus CBS 707.79]|uniref:P-loop containing nucleoside triphosphate hydrolase protein n=1 Tax=Aspergillus ellipticus CBS 707.79 TaxID=1448320 RepID=A0A319DN61_9EURO|nr:hypothetical protein BO71DRAFT_449343 [Aspergillus ellipticus CBS 707.79]